MKPLKFIYVILLFSITSHPKSFFIYSLIIFIVINIGAILLNPTNIKVLQAHKNYYTCLAFINFDGLTCEIFFNTFNSFRQTMNSVITITPIMATYPLIRFFNLKYKQILKAPHVLSFVFGFLIWLNFFFDP